MKRTIPTATSPELIAPCGLNCRLCRAYQRAKKPCPGCRGSDASKAKTCVTCPIKNCRRLADGSLAFCYSCPEFPCARLAHLDKRYRAKYATSVIENLQRIQASGIADFVEADNARWACPQCGALLCMHDRACPSCGYLWHDPLGPGGVLR